jgi:hypothetical protein
MGADALVAFYGIRYEIQNDEESLLSLEENRDPRCLAARRAKLACYWGRPTDGEHYFLFIGTKLGSFGIQGDVARSFTDQALIQIAEETKAKLREAQLEGEPKLWLQFEGQY